MAVRIMGIIAIAALLFSYAPAFSMDECQEEHPIGAGRLDCGYVFHCPIAFDPPVGPDFFYYFGQLIAISFLTKVEEPAYPIFHPPE